MSADTTRSRLLGQVEKALEEAWGCALTDLPPVGLAIAPARRATSPLAVRTDGGALLIAEPSWERPWQDLIATVSAEELFSIFGVYELARTTLLDGVSAFGPVWHYLADRQSFQPAGGKAVEQLDQDALRCLDPATYWHCSVDDDGTVWGFAIRHKDRVIALATVWRNAETLWEIGVDVLPSGQGQGRGRAVVSAAMEWILGQAPLAAYTTGAFNIPSSRTAHSLGYRHVWSTIKRTSGPFVAPPGPLGRPLPDIVPQPYWQDYPEE